jgi:hypothetical protein
MTKSILLFPVLIIGALLTPSKKSADKDLINPIVGNASYIETFGKEPDASVDEDLRIQTHLLWVENKLREKNTCGLSEEMVMKRNHVLDLLHNYAAAATFPRNYDHQDRRPCFIDKDGRICAVGYLVEQTAGRPAAEAINAKFKYTELMDMKDPLLDNWVASSGLTKEECAMIQPQYNNPDDTYTMNNVSKGNAVTSSLFTGLNVSTSIINGVQLSRGAPKKTLALAGMISGAAQTVYGISKFPETRYGNWSNSTNEGEKALSMVNIGVGTTTMLLSAWNYFSKKKPVEKKMTWNLQSFETPNNKIGMAFSLTRRI